MDEIVVKKQKFDVSIKNIEKLQQINRQLPEISAFQEKAGPFNLFSHRVTGEEMNVFGSEIQDNFLIVNNKLNQFYKQFIEIYNAFESLDKEYIAGIVGAFNQAIEATKKAEDAQKDINKTVELLKTTVEKIKEFNTKVSYELTLIDCDNWRENALKHKAELEQIDHKADEIIKTINGYQDAHNQLITQLTENIKERKKYKGNLIACWVVSGTLLLCLVVLIILIVFNVL